MAAVKWWDEHADVLILRGEHEAAAYRVHQREDVFQPRWVSWWYGGTAMHALRAVLTIVSPGRAGPMQEFAAPEFAYIPTDERKPCRIRMANGQ